MKVAVIGANGFIGSRLIEHYHLGGQHEVFPIVRKPSGLALAARFSLEWRLGDALDLASLSAAVHGCDAIVHVAIGDPAQIKRMPAILCAAAAAAGTKRVVYLSSASVHGQNPEAGTTEATPLHTNHSLDYNNAKVLAEQTFFTEANKHGLDAHALRPGVVYGPRSRWVADLAHELSEGHAWLFDEGRGICNGIYVDNLIAAIDCCLSAPAGANEAFLIGDAETTTWADFYRPVAAALNIPWATIHQLRELPAFEKTLRDRVENAVAQPWAQSLLPVFPFKLKRATKTLIASWNPPVSADAWSLPPKPQPRITEEMALLQQCRWKLSHEKAAQLLGYRPPVPCDEAMRRSLAWLRFAGFDFPKSK